MVTFNPSLILTIFTSSNKQYLNQLDMHTLPQLRNQPVTQSVLRSDIQPVNTVTKIRYVQERKNKQTVKQSRKLHINRRNHAGS